MCPYTFYEWQPQVFNEYKTIPSHINHLITFQTPPMGARFLKNTYLGICFMASSKGILTFTFLKVFKIYLYVSSIFVLFFTNLCGNGKWVYGRIGLFHRIRSSFLLHKVNYSCIKPFKQ